MNSLELDESFHCFVELQKYVHPRENFKSSLLYANKLFKSFKKLEVSFAMIDMFKFIPSGANNMIPLVS